MQRRRRRHVLAAFGIIVGGGPVVGTVLTAQQSAAEDKRRAIIRTVVRDVDPREITGATLMHEHLGIGRRPPARAASRTTRLPLAPPKMPAGWRSN
jgi:hypothetical protein